MKDKISLKQALVMGGALFSMHFGASCMLYPVTWGIESGSAVWITYIGIFLSAILLPFLGYTALSRGNGTFLGITRRVNTGFANAYCAITVLILGPIYVIPRMSAAAWEAILQLTSWNPTSRVPVILFTILYYALTYWFVSVASKIMDRLGMILFPVLIVIVVAIIIKGIATPMTTAMQPQTFTEPPVIFGFLQGYATGDLQCALLFGLVVISGLQNAQIRKEKLNANLLRVGIVGLGLLALTHLGHMLVGSHYTGMTDLTLSRLYAWVVLQLWGTAGGIFFSVALVAASLSTAVGLAASTIDFCQDAFGSKVRYRALAVGTCALSAVISCIGLSGIVSLIGPLLDACYPAAIVLVLYYTFMPQFERPNRMRGLLFAMIAACVIGVLYLVHIYDGLMTWNLASYEAFYSALPLSQYSLAWIPASAAAYIVGSLIRGKNDAALPAGD